MDPATIHKIFLGHSPSEAHSRLYCNFPRYRGFSQAESSPELFEATFIVALTQAMGEKARFNRTYLFVPSSMVNWVNEQTGLVARSMFGRLKGRDTPEKRRKVCEHLGASLKMMLVGSRVLQMDAPPSHWMAFGFKVSDPVPEWLRDALLPV